MKLGTMSVRFFILKKRTLKNGEAPIILRITIDGDFDEARIMRSVNTDLWNQDIGLSSGKDRAAKELNEYIHTIHTRTKEIHKELLLLGAMITPGIILRKLFNKEDQVTVLKVFREHNEECRKLIGIDFAYSTVNRYDNCLQSLSTVIEKEYGKEDISFHEFNGDLIRKYELYLKLEKGLATNTLVRYMKAIKKISNLAIAKGYLKTDPFAGLKFRQPKTNPVFLTMEELERVMGKELDIERVDLVRDVFVFCCWTGLAFIDVQNLKKEHIIQDNKGMHWIRKARQKTDTMCNIPLLDIPLSIIKKYEGHKMCESKGILLPVMCNQKFNSYLKEIADLCGIDKPISSHCARHRESFNYVYSSILQSCICRQVTI